MISFPKAKINLGLRIRGKRQDGFHDIETIFYPVRHSDALEFVEFCKPESDDQLMITGLDIGTAKGSNLVLMALSHMREKFTIPLLKIHLHKAIPAGAGLGGGSSDAACFLKALQKKFNLPVSDEELKSIALKIGSDCPFFINPVPSYASGRGEILEPVDPVLKNQYIVLLNPGLEISTREAYHNCHPKTPETDLRVLIKEPVREWRNNIINDFEEFAFKKHPPIGELKDALYRSGAVYSSMSGSGSTVYGIFETRPRVAEKIRKVMIWEGVL